MARAEAKRSSAETAGMGAGTSGTSTREVQWESEKVAAATNTGAAQAAGEGHEKWHANQHSEYAVEPYP